MKDDIKNYKDKKVRVLSQYSTRTGNWLLLEDLETNQPLIVEKEEFDESLKQGE